MTQANAESGAQDAISLLQTIFIVTCISYASNAVQLYEYFITMDQEIELVWRRKTRFSIPSILLVSTRICMVVSPVLSIAGPSSTCTLLKLFNILQQIAELAVYIQVALFSALRVSALYNRNIVLFVAVFGLGLVPVGTNIFNQSRRTYIQEPGICLSDSSVSDALTQKFVLISRIPIIVADFVVLALTWAKTYEQIRLSRGSRISIPLSTCLARDGALYFMALLGINILQITTNRTHLGAPMGIIVITVPPVLINRFMLNLRQIGNGRNASDPVESLDLFVTSTPRFQLSDQVVGSMGEPLEHGVSVPDEEEDEAEGEHIEVDEVDGHSPQREERRGAQEWSAEANGSGAVSV